MLQRLYITQNSTESALARVFVTINDSVHSGVRERIYIGAFFTGEALIVSPSSDRSDSTETLSIFVISKTALFR